MNLENPIITSSLLALLAMSSLIFGAFVGLKFSPSKKINATILAFGAGALVQALSLELAYEGAERLLREGTLTALNGWSIVAFGFLIGGLIYNYGNKLAASKGGALRHTATANKIILEEKRERSKNNLKILSNIKIMRELPAEEIELVFDKIESVNFKKNETIFNEGDHPDALYLILDGEVDIFTSNKKRKTKINTLKNGDSFGEMALLNDNKRSASAKTKTNTTIWKIERNNFLELLNESPTLKTAVEKLSNERIEQNIDSEENEKRKLKWEKLAIQNIKRVTAAEQQKLIENHKEKPEAPIAIFLGAVLDGIPESIIIGASFISLSTFNPNFLVAVFLSNFPEAMSSACTMKRANFSNSRIYSLWGGLVLVGGISAMIGNAIFSNANPIILTLVEAIAGGGILAMISNVMMPEAFEEGGDVVGIATIFGFMSAFYFSLH